MKNVRTANVPTGSVPTPTNVWQEFSIILSVERDNIIFDMRR